MSKLTLSILALVCVLGLLAPAVRAGEAVTVKDLERDGKYQPAELTAAVDAELKAVEVHKDKTERALWRPALERLQERLAAAKDDQKELRKALMPLHENHPILFRRLVERVQAGRVFTVAREGKFHAAEWHQAIASELVDVQSEEPDDASRKAARKSLNQLKAKIDANQGEKIGDELKAAYADLEKNHPKMWARLVAKVQESRNRAARGETEADPLKNAMKALSK
jgi:hypothetical protein